MKESIARITHAAQIYLRFGDLACENFDVSAGVPPRDLSCEGLHFFAPGSLIYASIRNAQRRRCNRSGASVTSI